MLDTIGATPIAAAVGLGGLLGVTYFGGLWWTVRRMSLWRYPLGFYFGSLIGRLTVLLGAFYGLLGDSSGPRLAAALVGFLTARLLLIRLLGRESAGAMGPREAA